MLFENRGPWHLDLLTHYLPNLLMVAFILTEKRRLAGEGRDRGELHFVNTRGPHLGNGKFYVNSAIRDLKAMFENGYVSRRGLKESPKAKFKALRS